MKKTFLTLWFLLTFAVSVFGADGILTGEKNIQIVKTKWFDIIYPESCIDSAAVLFSEADYIYENLASTYCLENPPCRIPVVLTSKVEVFNAYFSNAYYNHIVLYVTSASDSINDQEDSLLSTFKHELTHALTYNIKSPFFEKVGKIFGDAVNLSLLTITSGMAEGATLTSESMEGYGRLNDEFAKQSVKQAKIEGKLPTYDDIQGSRDIYPTGAYYYFNGAFHEYLQNRFGMEKYKQWWYLCNNSTIFADGAFKTAFGAKLRVIWKDFLESYEVPEILSNPVIADQAKDFFEPDELNYSIRNKTAFRPVSLSISKKGLTYINDYNRTLYFVSKENLNSENIKPVKLFQFFYMESAVQSEDGKYIAVTYFDTKSAVYNYHVEVYDTESKKWIYKTDKGHKKGTVIISNGECYLVSQNFCGEKKQIEIASISQKKEPVYIDFERNAGPDFFAQAVNGNIAYILKDKMNYSIQIADINGNILNSYAVCDSDSQEFPKFIMKYLSLSMENQNELYFSWVSKGTMPRAGKLNLESGEFTLSKTDLSGGVYFPVVSENALYYEGQFYEQNRLFQAKDLFENSVKISSVINLQQNNSETSETTVIYNPKEMLEKSKKYAPFSYMNRGIIYPFSDLQSTSFNSDSFSANTGSKVSYYLPFGVTYLTNNPWNSKLIKLTAGYGINTNSWAVAADYSGNTSTNLFSYDFSLMSEFDIKGWKAADFDAAVALNCNFGKYSTISVKPTNTFHIGRSNNSKNDEGYISHIRFRTYESIDPDIYLYERAGAVISYNSLRTYGNSRFSRCGFLTGIYPYYSLSYNLSQNQQDYTLYDIGLFSMLYIPQLLPVECPMGFTYNLPVKIAAAAFSTSLTGSSLLRLPVYPNLAFVAAESVLFSYEIQKSLPFFPLFYFYDVRIDVAGAFGYGTEKRSNLNFLKVPEYCQGIADGTVKPQGSVSLELTVGINPINAGGSTNASAKYYLTGAFNLIFKPEATVPSFSFWLQNKF